jgi:hypothetical protein
MSATAGDLIEARVEHPTLGNHTFYPKSNESVTKDGGGYRANDDANAVTAVGMITQINLVRASLEMVVANDENVREDADFAIALSGAAVDGEWTFTHKNGVTLGMTGRPVGDIQPDLNVGTFTLKIAGTNMRKISG